MIGASSFFLVTAIAAAFSSTLLCPSTDAFQSHSVSRTVPAQVPQTTPRQWAMASSSLGLSSTPLWSTPVDVDSACNEATLRDRLRTATGFSLTVFRATIRGITGISLSAIYAATVAATGLWIRKFSSIILSIFPSWFRYFLQPFLMFYYAPLFILRNLAGPTRQNAKKKHATVLEAWKEAVEYAEKTEQDGYWPVVISDDGYFEMVAPPNPEDTTPAEAKKQFSKAMADTVEQAMEVNDASNNNTMA